MIPEFTSTLATLAGVAVAAYLVGSIPFGLLLTKLLGLTDPRTIGSRNIGASNVLRTGSKTAAGLTLLLDGGKGLAAVLITGLLFDPDAVQIAGLMAFIGHLFPIWLKLRGGKGVATYLGVLLALSPAAGIVTCLTWLTVAFIVRISSACAIVAVILAPVWLILLSDPTNVGAIILMSALVLIRHHQNIKRLMAGSEPKIKFGRGKQNNPHQ